MYNTSGGTNNPQGTTKGNCHKMLDAKTPRMRGRGSYHRPWAKWLRGKVPGEEEQQIWPRTGAGGSRRDRDGSGMVGDSASERGTNMGGRRGE